MKNNLALKVAGTVFLLISGMHILRVFLRFELTVAGFMIPVWFNIIGFVISILLALWMFKAIQCSSSESKNR